MRFLGGMKKKEGGGGGGEVVGEGGEGMMDERREGKWVSEGGWCEGEQ